MTISATSASSLSSLGFVSSEAEWLIEKAKNYRAEMEGLPPDDPRREVYDIVIRDLLDRSRRLSSIVVSSTSVST